VERRKLKRNRMGSLRKKERRSGKAIGLVNSRGVSDER
jgi:hypothetical protein